MTPDNANAATVTPDLSDALKAVNTAANTPAYAARVHFGNTVTYTIQLKAPGANTGDDPVNASGDGQAFTLVRETYNGIDITATGALLSRTTDRVEVGADGSATFTISVSDPDPTAGNTRTGGTANVRTVTWTITEVRPTVDDPTTTNVNETEPTLNLNTTDGIQTDGSEQATGRITFSDEARKVLAVSVMAGGNRPAPAANKKVGAAATVTVLDQYGRPFPGVSITLISDTAGSALNDDGDDAGSDPDGYTRITERNGSVRVGYSYGGGAAVEALTATFTPDATDDSVPESVSADGTTAVSNPANSAQVYWVGLVTDAATGVDGGGGATVELANDRPVHNHDAGSRQIVVDSGLGSGGAVQPVSLNYDGNDFYQVTVTGGSATPKTMAEFVEELDKALAAYADDPTNVARPTLSWSSYDYEDESVKAWFQLTVPAS